jgi:hypothetical protein
MTMSRSPACGLGLLALVLGAGAPATASVTRAIKLDHFGYRPADPKVAVFTSNPGATVQVRTAGGTTVFTIPTDGGSISSRGFDAASGDQVWWVDFSPVNAAGSYHLHSPSLGAESYTFAIGPAVYNDAVRAALKTFYYQRFPWVSTGPKCPVEGPVGTRGEERGRVVFLQRRREATCSTRRRFPSRSRHCS